MPKAPHVLTTIPGVSAEQTLIGAILQQALHDLDSPYPLIRSQAYRFFQDEQAVRSLAEVANLNGDVVLHLIGKVMAARLARPD